MPEVNSIPFSSTQIEQYPGHVPGTPTKPKLLDRLRETLRSRHYSRRTEQTYCHWIKRFIFFHNKRHPIEMGEPEINAFLTHLAPPEFHDRIVFVDDLSCWVMGQSIKDAAKAKPTYLLPLPADIAKLKLTHYEAIWVTALRAA